ncbi:arginase [Brumimicrobium aurantiacum]|uniref:Arginase n=1 Tax=Brumimicrobium aurantiacum TaxID=1737063 RepID=A0A3E1EUU0_9FLAO|nr:arginase [Brumimicrobium aurantiacum]RFC53336.1 arginase [Brumimicrobium aurantiacum]
MANSIAYIINDSEISAGTRGASLGPGALRVVDDNSKNFLFSRYPIHYVKTMNHLLDKPTEFQWGKRADGLATVYKNVAEVVSKQRKQNDFTLVIAGDHGSAGGTIAGLKMANPENRIGVLWVDAHGDLHTPYTTPTGNMHGMPLATALNEDNLESKINDPLPDTIKFWNEMKNTGQIAPKIQAEDLGFIGLRDLETPEVELMERKGIKNISVNELRSEGVRNILSRLDEKYAECDEIYLSFDVDSMDPDLTSHGTGTPVDHGISIEEAGIILRHFAGHPKVKCIEFVEINPCLDEKTNRMAEVAYGLIKEVIDVVERKA